MNRKQFPFYALAIIAFWLAGASFAWAQQPIFGIYRELWTNLNANAGGLDALTNTAWNPNWPNNPAAAYTKVYTNFETEVNTGMNYYGERLRTFVVPPTNGNYTFWISSDDNSQLFLSTDENPANSVVVASVPGWTASREWGKYPNQQSAPIYLEAGRRYYVETRMQQGTGGDNLAVRWELPNYTMEEPMTASSAAGTRLVPYNGLTRPPGIYQQSTNPAVVEGQNVFLSVLVTNTASVGYQWSLNGNNISGALAAKPFYWLTNVSIAVNNGQVYRCAVTNALGSTPSAPITLTVLRDTVPPAVVRTVNVGSNGVQIVYSKPVEAASATNLANYQFTNGLGITGASLGSDNATVMLATAPLVYGSNYTILISGVRDRASIPNTIAPNTPASFTALLYTPQDIGSPPGSSALTVVSNGLNVSAVGSDIGGSSDQFSFSYQLRTGDFDIALRLAGLSGADAWAKAGVMARETLDAGSRFAAALSTPSMTGSFFEWRDPAFSLANLAGSFLANYPNTWLRLKRAGTTFTGFASYDGQTWVQLGSANIAMASQLYVGLAISSHDSAIPAIAQFRDIVNVTNAVVVGAIPNPREPLGPCSRLTPIVISEIMYKPSPRADTNNLEFIELYNSNPFYEDISGFQLAGGSIGYTFPPGTILRGGAFLVVAASPGSIATVYGISNVTGPYVGSLKKSGTVQLLDEQGAVLLTVPYSDVYPWPVAALGTGHSIVLARPSYGEGDPRAWAISDTVGGSPGQMDAFHPSGLRNVVINELLAHSENPGVLQFIELYNHSNQTNDLSGCILTDDPATNKYVIAAGTVIGPRGFLSFDQAHLGFALNGAGGTVYLIQADSSRVLDAVQFEGQADGVSFGRWPNGADQFYPLATRTPGSSNSGIYSGDVVINELMYDSLSGNDDDQYIELYNKGTNTVNLANWQLISGVSFTFPANVNLAPDSYLVIGGNVTNLFAKYGNLNAANTLGNWSGKLSHKGERVALAMPQSLTSSNSFGRVTNTIYVVEDEVTYGTGGRWGQWAHGGGSSLELITPNTNHRLAYNWADSDETAKSVWTNLEFTGVLDNGANYTNGFIDLVQLGLLDIGECLVDNIEVRPGGTNGANIVANGDFEAGLANWSLQGDHVRSSLETGSGLGGYQSAQSLHLRSSDGMWTLADYAQGTLTQRTLGAGQTATLRLKARWLHGWPEILMRLRGNWLEVTGTMPVPRNPGTPGMRNSRYVANAPPAIFEVKHSPPIPAANQPVVVTARFHDLTSFQPTLLYRIDTGVNPAPTYSSVPMVDDGTGGDGVAGDGVYSATIPAQASGTVVAFLVQSRDSLGAASLFPADLGDNAGVPRECVVAFGDPVPTGSFSHHHVFITQNWANRWAQGGGVSHELHDGTWVDGGGRIVYDWKGRYAGSPYHQYLGSPVTTIGGNHWIMPEDDQVFGTTSFNKQHVPGNGPLDDTTLLREQTAFWMGHQIGLRRQNRRYYVYYVNGYRHGPLMEDAQVPGAEMLKEYWPNDSNGWLFKNHIWFEGDVAQQSSGYMQFSGISGCLVDRFTTTINGVPNQYKLARYRWMWWIRQYPDSANDFSQVYALIDAANTPTTDPNYYRRMEAQMDTEEWVKMTAIELATGDWDSFLTQDSWNMYCYKPTMGKWTALKWDWNISLGNSSSWGPDGSHLFNLCPNDSVMSAFLHYPPYYRAFLRALQDIANLAMNNAVVDPVLNAKYAAFVANGFSTTSYNGPTVTDPGASGGLKSWIATMQNSILSALAGQGVTSIPFAVNSWLANNNTLVVSGTAPLQVKTVWFNGVEWPVTWNNVQGWTVTVPLQPGTNAFTVVGVDLHGQPVAGASTTLSFVYSGAAVSPVGHVVINEIMYAPAVPGAQYLELYNNSAATTFDLSGWQMQSLAYTFPPGSLLGPAGYLLLAANRSAFATGYGGTIPVFDEFNGALSPAGQTLFLVQPGTNSSADLTVAGVRYSSSAPWPLPSAGSSLELIDATRDNWRVANWAVNGTSGAPQWRYAVSSGVVTNSTLFIYLQNAGEAYVDDIKLVAGTVPESGTNLLADGDFESGFPGPWSVSPNLASSGLSTTTRHSGTASLHLVATSGGGGLTSSISQTPALVRSNTYTLSFWYLENLNGGTLTLRISTSGIGTNVNLQPQGNTISLTTPGSRNSAAGSLASFPPLWLNELQADNLTGISNSASQHTPWFELYNPTTNVVSLNGLFLANNYNNLTQWAFPNGASINPGEFKVIFADGQTNLSTLAQLHTSFSLISGSGALALSGVFNGQHQVLDYIDYTNIGLNHSYGSLPDGQSFFRQEFFFASPGAVNNGAVPPSYIGYSNPGSVYTQNFDALPDPGPTSVNSANPVTINGVTYSLANPFDFALPANATGNSGGLGLVSLSGWYGLAQLTSKFGATDGDQTTGGVISFGLPGSANRALGLLATSSTGGTAFGAKFINQTTNTLNSISVQVTGEVWRQSNLPKTLLCFYFIDPTGTAPFSLNATGALTNLNVSLSTVPSAVGGIAVDGTAAVNQTNLSVVNQSINDWPPGAALWLVWEMADPTGRAQGLAIDNLSFSASVQTPLVPVPLSVLSSGTSLVMSWPTTPGQSYQIEYKDDLAAPTWTPLGVPLSGIGLPLSVTNDFSAATQRFFRLSILP